MAVWGDHHGDLDALRPQSGDAPGPFSFDRGSPFEIQAKLGKKCDGGVEGFYHDADVVHPLKTHFISSHSRPETSDIAIHWRLTRRRLAAACSSTGATHSTELQTGHALNPTASAATTAPAATTPRWMAAKE